MKIKSLFFVAFATMALASCNDDEGMSNSGSSDNPMVEKGDAYISFAMKMPTSITRANGDPNGGSMEESKVTTALALLFDGDQPTSKLVTKKELVWTGGTATFAGKASDAFKVDATATKILVIANPTEKIASRAEEGAILATVKEAFQVDDQVAHIDSLATNDKFTMSNYKLVDCASFIVKGVVGESESSVKDKAKTKPVVVPVDRLVSKVTLDLTSMTSNANATVTVEEWALNVTNKTYLLLPDTCVVGDYANVTNAAEVAKFLYTKDNNFENNFANAAAYAEQFNANNALVAVANNASLYCTENTMQATDQLYKYTTQALLKVKFLPKKDINENVITGSWFRFEGNVYNATDIKAAVADTKASATLKAAAAAFVTATTATDFAAAVDAADASTSAKVKATGIEYFHDGMSYYQVMIRHNQFNVNLMTLGRYGVVRNNWYTLSVKSISEPGLSYQKNETEIFEDATKDDVLTYISVQITVKPWTTWTQNVEL